MQAQTPIIHPFTKSAECVKCGVEEGTISPMMGMMGIHTRYCPGGQEPEAEPDKNPLDAILSMMPGVSGYPRANFRPRINICAGIGEEHLHKTCPRCGFEWLTKVLERP